MTDSSVSLTGISQYQDVSRLPPPGYDIRDILKSRKPVEDIETLMNEDEKKQWNSFERLYCPGYTLYRTVTMVMETHLIVDCSEHIGIPVRPVYLMHPRCWDILLQQHALIASPSETRLDLKELANIFLQIPLGKKGGGFEPDWATDYGAREPFWWIAAVEMEIFEQAPEWKFLQRDPGIACGFNELFANPPLESEANMSPRIHFVDDGGDIFSRLPVEIITETLMFLPSASVRDLQLASRKIASVHLSSRYWRSRFEFPNELCHVTLPPALLRSGQVGGQWVDWRRLCDRLLHPVGEKPGWWRNRERITALNRQLVKSMSLRDSHGRLKKVEDVPTLE